MPLQTLKSFPTGKRPKVLRLFFKNAHKYTKNYELDAESLGTDTMSWWEEIKAKGSVRFGGPTGMYSLVVLMTWWCSLLEGRPDNELIDCLRTIEEIDNAILSVVRNTNSPSPTLPSPSQSSPAILPAHKSRGLKRTASGEPFSKSKRLRSGKA